MRRSIWRWAFAAGSVLAACTSTMTEAPKPAHTAKVGVAQAQIPYIVEASSHAGCLALEAIRADIDQFVGIPDGGLCGYLGGDPNRVDCSRRTDTHARVHPNPSQANNDPSTWTSCALPMSPAVATFLHNRIDACRDAVDAGTASQKQTVIASLPYPTQTKPSWFSQ